MERIVQRWIVDTSVWNPSSSDFINALSLLPSHEHPSITRYIKNEDRKRAFVCRLLQYAIVHQTFGIPFEGKPFVVMNSIEIPNFNFNVSHHGDYVAITSEPFCLVGLDILSHSNPVEKEFITEGFSSFFSSMEWFKIMNAGTSDDILKEFYRYWTLKEAFVKAIGTGLGGYQLDSLEFHHVNWNDISVKIHGKEAVDWKFCHFELKEGLYVSIARGSPCMATESYKQVQGKIDLDENAYDSWLNLPNPNFLWKTVEELMPN